MCVNVLGMFWMSFADLVKHFSHVDVCMVRHKLYHPVPWVEKRSRYCACFLVCLYLRVKFLHNASAVNGILR